MGFLDSFFTGVGTFLGSPIGTALGQIGVAKLVDVIGLSPTGPSGSPRSGMAPFQPLGTPTRITEFKSAQTLAEEALLREEELRFFASGQPFGVRPSLGPQVFRPGFAAPLPSIPSSQPFGVQPGTGLVPLPPGGFNMPAFPTAVQASFPSSPFTTGNPFFQQAGFAGAGAALLRQIPGILGGAAGGALVAGGGGGGGGTPPFRATMAGARAQFFRTENPVTGQDTWFRPAGRPLLWSGDLTACKRVNKIARRAKRKR